jgi:hypothetical protein
MPGNDPRYRPTIAEQIAKQLTDARDVTAHAVKLLRRLPKPDAFAGRKTQEPFPSEEDQSSAAR